MSNSSYSAADLDDKYDTPAKTTNYTYVYWVLLVVVIIIMIYAFSSSSKYSNKELADKYYKDLHGDANDESARKAIEYGKKIENPTALDSYRLGSAYLINAQNPREANKHFTKALEKIISGKTSPTDAIFIVERIDEFKDRFMDHPDLEDLPLQHALAATFEAQYKKAQDDKASGTSADKKLLARKHWNSESQNVHDSAIYDTLKKQIYHGRELNAKIPGIETKNYAYISNWLRMKYCDDAKKAAKIDKVLKLLDNNYPTRLIPNVNEQDVFVTAWRRSQDPANAARMTQMLDAFGDAVLDCVEGDHPVCIDGRIAKIWQSLAMLDNDKEMGVMRSKQMIRNEIYEKCANAVRMILDSASDEVKAAYNSGAECKDGLTDELITQMRNEINKIGAEYKDKLDRDSLSGIINECLAVV